LICSCSAYAAQRQALQEQINQVPTRDEVAQKVAQAEALDQSMNLLALLFELLRHE
jgi:hypothetical protein